MPTKTTTDAEFTTDVLESEIPVVVDFWAEWCGPCKVIGPALEEIADELKGKIKVVKVNIDENPETPMQYGVRGIPTLLIFEKGVVKAEKIGAAPKSKLSEWVEQSL